MLVATGGSWHTAGYEVGEIAMIYVQKLQRSESCQVAGGMVGVWNGLGRPGGSWHTATH